MIIDRKNNPWVIASLIILGVATVFYFPYSRRMNGPSGGSFWGLVYGAVGSAMMLAVMMLALRKKFRTARVGRVYHWMQAHVWLGIIAYPIILYHAGFRWGGTLTQIIMYLFTVVVVTGVYGIVMQNIIPSLLFREVQFETVYDQIDKIVGMIRADADARMANLEESAKNAERFEMDLIPAGSALALAGAGVALMGGEKGTRSAVIAPGIKPLKDFYTRQVRPFLHDESGPDSKISTAVKSQVVFDQMRQILPPSMHELLDDLYNAVEERRQLARQKRLHWWMHSWLVIHVPLSYALIVLSIFHAVTALRYTT